MTVPLESLLVMAPPGGSLKFNTPSGETGTLFPWREQLNVNKFPFSPDEVILSEETKGLFCPGESSSDTRKPLLQELVAFLQVMLNEACMANLGLVEGSISRN